LKIGIHSSQNDLKQALKKIDLTEGFFNIVLNNWLLRHMLQPATINSVWNLYDVELVLNSTNVIKTRDANLGYLNVSIHVLSEIVSILEITAKELQS